MYNKLVKNGFECSNCHKWIPITNKMGTSNRNHCPYCLYSKHVDLKIPGDRKASCQALMKPIGLTFKQEGVDKYGKPRQGELMLIHSCTKEDKISINRVAADDNPESILELFRSSSLLENNIKKELINSQIILLTEENETEVKKQLYGLLTKS